jgi:CHASE2 domain-containing sensor protein
MVGWGGGALGPLFVGWMTTYGGNRSKIENMSTAIAVSAGFYLVAAVLMLAAWWLHRRSNSTGRLVAQTC